MPKPSPTTYDDDRTTRRCYCCNRSSACYTTGRRAPNPERHHARFRSTRRRPEQPRSLTGIVGSHARAANRTPFGLRRPAAHADRYAARRSARGRIDTVDAARETAERTRLSTLAAAARRAILTRIRLTLPRLPRGTRSSSSFVAASSASQFQRDPKTAASTSRRSLRQCRSASARPRCQRRDLDLRVLQPWTLQLGAVDRNRTSSSPSSNARVEGHEKRTRSVRSTNERRPPTRSRTCPTGT